MRTEKILSSSSFLIPFGVYLLTMANTVSFFDSGELITGASTLGISHPPGYPLYVLVGHIFTFSPFGNEAFRVNLLSAFFGALSSMMIYFISLSLLDQIFKKEGNALKVQLTAFSTAHVFAFSLNQWGQTNMSEVYAMNTFFIALIIFIFLRWRKHILITTAKGNITGLKYIYLTAFLFGLGFGDHHTILVIVPVALLFVALSRWQILLNVKAISMTVFFSIAGFSIYIYMPVRATTELMMNWGDPDNLAQFLWMFLREGYPRASVSRDWSLFLSQLETINVLYEFTLVGFFIGIAGFFRFISKGRLYAAVTLAVFLVLSVGIVIYGNPPRENIFLIEAFHTPSYMVFAPWIGVGFFWLLSTLDIPMRKLMTGKYTEFLSKSVWIFVLVAFPSVLFYHHYDKNDRSRNFIAFDYAMNELKSLSSTGILFTWGDSGAFPLWYLQYVERYQPGVLLLHTPHLGSSWYVDNIPDLKNSRLRRIPESHRDPAMVVEVIAKENIGNRISYIDYSSKYSFPIRGLDFVPYGIVYRQASKKEKIDTSIWNDYVMRGILSPNILRDLDIGKAISIYGFCLYDNGYALLKEGRREEATALFTESIKIVPGLRPRVQNALFSGGRRP